MTTVACLDQKSRDIVDFNFSRSNWFEIFFDEIFSHLLSHGGLSLLVIFIQCHLSPMIYSDCSGGWTKTDSGSDTTALVSDNDIVSGSDQRQVTMFDKSLVTTEVSGDNDYDLILSGLVFNNQAKYRAELGRGDQWPAAPVLPVWGEQHQSSCLQDTSPTHHLPSLGSNHWDWKKIATIFWELYCIHFCANVCVEECCHGVGGQSRVAAAAASALHDNSWSPLIGQLTAGDSLPRPGPASHSTCLVSTCHDQRNIMLWSPIKST